MIRIFDKPYVAKSFSVNIEPMNFEVYIDTIKDWISSLKNIKIKEWVS